MSILFSELKSITGGTLERFTEDLPVEHLFNDSRTDLTGKSGLFFAIHGRNYDGHNFILNLYDRGIRNFITEEKIDLSDIPLANILLVPSSVEAMQRIATYKRKEFSLEVIGITGSNGKTIVKEWLFGLMAPYRQCVKNPASYNSQIGVPLSVWKIEKSHDLGIFEAGISRTGEMENLELVIRPTVGIFTNIGTAHDAGFENQIQKADEKAKLFVHCDVVIYCKDHAIIDNTLINKSLPGYSWGKNTSSDIIILSTETGDNQTTLTLSCISTIMKLTIPFTDSASVENAMHCIAYMCYRGFDQEKINNGLAQLSPLKMRLEYKKGINQCMIIDDTYNNDIVGLSTAIEYLNRHAGEKTKTLILSDIHQSGKPREILYNQVNDLLHQGKIDKFIGIGPDITSCQQTFSLDNVQFFSETALFLEELNKQTFSNEVILIKGARPFAFEKIIERLESQAHGTVLEVNLKALLSNLYYYKGVVGKDVKIMAMLKALAYGSGSHEVAEVLSQQGIDYFGVAYADEGVGLRKHGIKTPVMVMNPSENVFQKLIDYKLEPEIYSLKILESFASFLKGAKAGIHIKFDTGMYRLGFSTDEIETLISILKLHPNIHVKSIFSHLASSDIPDHDDFTHSQAKLLVQNANTLKDRLGINPILHLLNTTGITRFPEYRLNMVRTGIGLYGIKQHGDVKGNVQNVLSLKSYISQVKSAKPGSTVGYGRKGKVLKDTKTAVVAIGYADGFSRGLSNGIGYVLINGKKAPVIGNVCMDMTMVDVTGIEVKTGDEVIIFGQDLPVTTLAEQLNTIPYEIISRISARIKRVYFYG